MKRNRLLIVVGSVCLVLMLLASLLAGCAPDEEEVVVTPEEEEEEEEVAPAVEEEVYKLTYQGTGTPGTHSMVLAEEGMINLIEEMAGGRVEIEYLPPGSLCATNELLNTTAIGTLDLGYASATVFRGQVQCGNVHWGLAGALRKLDELYHLYWFMEPRSWTDIYRDAVLDQAGCYVVGTGPAGAYGEVMSTVPIQRLSDVDGLMIRSFGQCAKIWESAGASLVTIAAAEMYTGLALGTIDAANWGGTAQFYDYSIHEVCPYFTGPPLVPYSEGGLYVNPDTWNELPDDIKTIFETAFRYIRTRYNTETYVEDITARNLMVDYGTIFYKFPEEDLSAIAAMAIPILEELAAGDKYAEEELATLFEYMEFLGYK